MACSRFLMSALLMASTACFANTASRIDVSDIQVHLIDILPNDGIAPLLQLNGEGQSGLTVYESSADPFSSVFDSSVLSGTLLGGLTSDSHVSAVGPVGHGQAALGGDPMAAGATMSAQAFAVGSPGQYAMTEIHGTISDYGPSEHFTLGLGTSLAISGHFDLGVSSTSPSSNEFAQSDVLFLLRSLDGTQTSVATADVIAGIPGISNDSTSGDFEIYLDGSTSGATQGQFFASMFSYASTEASTAVPVSEPAPIACLLLGLAVVGMARRALKPSSGHS